MIPNAHRLATKIQPALLALALAGALAPSAYGQATPETVDPAACTVEPRPLADFRLLPEAAPATPTLGSSPVATARATPGEPVTDPEVIAGVTATVRLHLACLNAWDIPRAAALYTDEAFLRSALGPGADASDAALESLLAPREIPREEWARLVAIEEIRRLPDGRITAEVVGTTLGSPEELRQQVTFVEVDGRYLIDAITELSALGTPTP